MSRARAALAALGMLTALGVLGACGDKAASTVLVARIESDLAVTGQIDEIRLKVQRPDSKGEREPRIPLGSAANLPVTVGLVPASGGEDEWLTLTAAAYKGGSKVLETVAEAQFVRGERRQIRMYLLGACLTSPCAGADQVCGAGGSCIPKRRGTEPIDLVPDASVTDSRPNTDAPVGMDGPMQDAPIGIDAPDAPIGDDAGNCTCPSDDNPCTQDFCMGGTCRHVPLGNRFGCPGGLCIDGVCCTGCIDNMGRCRLGNNVLFCGSASRDCVVCNDQDACTQDGCVDGICRTMPLSGPTCPTGVCVNGQCQCGGAGEPCCAGGACDDQNMVCMNGTCGGCGADGQPCCSSGTSGNTTCGPGLLCTGGRCGKCGEVSQPCCADGSCRTGVCGGAARVCQPCGGGAGQPCCPTGDACAANLTCVNGTCACGNPGQPCCGGSMCTDDGNACNGVEMCAGGVCTRSPAVVCTARSQCHMVGTCDPASGRCTEPIRPDGSMCNDGNGCTTGDMCRAGACVSSAQTICNDNRPCTDDVCMAPGGCAFPPSPKGKSCSPPGNPCRADACDDRGSCVAMAANEGGGCQTPTGQPGRCIGGGCCPMTTPPQLCPVPF